MTTNPLILTLQLDDASFRFFNAQRQRYFPPERNFLAAHLTLFHHLSPEEPQIKNDLLQLAASQNELRLQVNRVVFLGAGVAYKIESAALQQLHKGLQNSWTNWLIPQDKQTLWPHVTVQNKVAARVAKDLHVELSENWVPFEACGKGLQLWEYLGGPWKPVETFLFQPKV